ncbi:hypothetical protein RAS12_06565 [Achromobacter seleniivolatilans]|uniref:Uncharacterized protein n=1 Tax=Achromobacter seleniivolatilans TaxID=3047478 RepID=A0ABY9M5Q2_9BURK|nr:hypothetical protein [Achromobacter sp. R39]WMD22035.1 hypothetical protein RAS12_06565 [Achromobacter sp. R39]
MRIKKLFPFLDRTLDARTLGADTPNKTPAAKKASAAPIAAQRPATPVYQFTIVSVSATLNALRKQLYYELQGLNLPVLAVRISRAESDQLTSTVVTLHCPPHLRNLLNAVALRLGQSPDVRRVHWESDAGASIAVLPA